MNPITLTILGQPCSKANSRQIVVIGGRPKVIKSKPALEYERAALLQIPPRARVMLEGPVSVTLRLFYATELPDLDESIVLDVLQARYRRVGDRRELVQRGQGTGQGAAMLCIAGRGIVAGFSDGGIVRMTEGRYTTDAAEVDATFRMVNGAPQYLAVPQ